MRLALRWRGLAIPRLQRSSDVVENHLVPSMLFVVSTVAAVRSADGEHWPSNANEDPLRDHFNVLPHLR
jgi:hypothetical protein